ncbi:MAG: phosphoribosyl-ATP diphosphatase [Clostridiales bacterium]|nr:phosphoribosyl-ATP diphosphatase [Clostridiales bacterium]
MTDLGNALNKEFEVILNRKENPSEGSYTSYLFKKGEDKILKKIGEEAAEVIIAAKGESKEELIGEICDVLFHMEVLMAQKGLSWEDITAELGLRRQKENMNTEKEAKRKAENRTDETNIN